ncbi:MAG: toprim domain-containing protein [Candidatus Bathyarchaeia archaeon]
MSTRIKEKLEKILEILEQLIEESAKGTPIIVEGKKDVETLRFLGVKGKVIAAKTGRKSLLDVVSEIEEMKVNEIILLLDFDRRGKELTKSLRKSLEKVGVKLNFGFWDSLSTLIGKEVKDVEGLAKYMKTLRRKTGEPLSAF